ncbi:hypothetical protein LAZ67_13000696 [Cordylochernes scorpioides]|uniref:Transposase n=1 Tax=Cordylochernes scorpioides TaxID=51811 RepID=A0ABY6L376_9ARAC|nr:hypothetical protein LAZ67_13000696 [Cordylochernes scorpioides]
MDQRTCIKFCVKNEIKCADAFRMLTVTYEEATLDRSNVYRWYKMFSECREDVNDEERARRPSTSTTDEKINEVEKMILDNRRITVREVAEDLNISIGSCHSIFINDLGMRRVAAKFVPKLLNCDQKQHRMNIANEILNSVRDDPNFLQRVITGDEAGVVHHEFLPQGRTVNKEYYLQVMRNLRESIRQKRPDLWKNKNWLLHHDNAPAHTLLLVRYFLAKNNTLMMPQPPYSSELAPCDFFWFPKLKRPMKGRRYATLEIKTASKEELKKILKNDFLKCFEDWKNRWHKCLISHGDYFEGDKIALDAIRWPSAYSLIRFNCDDRPRGQDHNQIKKTPAKFIPRFLTNEQKLCRLATCEDMLEMTRTDPEWKDKIITGYETWVYGYDPETKHQSAEWRCQGELRPKKSGLLKSRNKVLLVLFLDKKGIFHHEYLPAGQTVIKDMYLGILRRLREAIRKKRPEKWTNGGWILHHDNARPHTVHLMTSFLAKNGTQILLQPPYFPDIAPNDFFLFPKLKAVLKGRHFDTRDDIIEISPLALKSIPKEAYKNCFDNWEKRWRWMGVLQYLSAPWKTFYSSHKVQAVVVEAEWKAWECPYTINEDTVALRKFLEQIKVELGAKDGEIEDFLLVYMMDEMDLGYDRQELALMLN